MCRITKKSNVNAVFFRIDLKHAEGVVVKKNRKFVK